MKRDKHDALFSKLIRERANWTCEACQKYYPEGQRQGLHCSHFFTRSRKAVRWFPYNAAAHCYACHTHLGGTPIHFANWIHSYLDRLRPDLCDSELSRLSNITVRWRKKDLEELYEEMKSELNRMESIRKHGFTGRIEFELKKVEEMLVKS